MIRQQRRSLDVGWIVQRFVSGARPEEILVGQGINRLDALAKIAPEDRRSRSAWKASYANYTLRRVRLAPPRREASSRSRSSAASAADGS
jgi:hypothetical protein